ncbi:hypothetical protein [Allosalinactinospora lopnorensis]|uniref:hypothetical protein n=1 Tax=Allosalinactinospora lopnorensis TaxID=1352348 RepID=UPI00373FD359
MSVWRTLLRKSGLWTADTEDEVRHRPTDGAGHGETPAMRAAALERILQESIEARGSTDPRSITARNNLASKYARSAGARRP